MKKQFLILLAAVTFTTFLSAKTNENENILEPFYMLSKLPILESENTLQQIKIDYKQEEITTYPLTEALLCGTAWVSSFIILNKDENLNEGYSRVQKALKNNDLIQYYKSDK